MSECPKFLKVYEHRGPSPEERLWMAVVIAFLQDVQKDYDEYRASLNGSRAKYWSRLVTHRICVVQPHMAMVSSFAGIDHDLLVDKVNKISDGIERI